MNIRYPLRGSLSNTYGLLYISAYYLWFISYVFSISIVVSGHEYINSDFVTESK